MYDARFYRPFQPYYLDEDLVLARKRIEIAEARNRVLLATNADLVRQRDALVAERKSLQEKDGRQFGEILKLGAQVFGLKRDLDDSRKALASALLLIGASALEQFRKLTKAA